MTLLLLLTETQTGTLSIALSSHEVGMLGLEHVVNTSSSPSSFRIDLTEVQNAKAHAVFCVEHNILVRRRQPMTATTTTTRTTAFYVLKTRPSPRSPATASPAIPHPTLQTQPSVGSIHSTSSATPPSNRYYTESFDTSDFLCRAALSLIEDRASRERNLADLYRRSYSQFPAQNEIVLIAILRKSGTKQLTTKPKLVTLAPGMLFVADLLNETLSVPPVMVEESSKLKTIPLSDKTIKSTDRRSQWSFEIIDNTRPVGWNVEKTRTFLCETKEDRDKWVRALEAAAHPEAFLLDDTTMPLRKSSSMAEMTKANDIRARCKEATVKDMFMSMLNDVVVGNSKQLTGAVRRSACVDDGDEQQPCAAETLVVSLPVEWLQTIMSRPRGDVDPNVSQAFKDTIRDSLSVNGNPVNNPTAVGVISALAREILRVWNFSGVEQERLSSARVLGFCRDILVSTSRTQTGGLLYEACKELFSSPILLIVHASDEPIVPIQFIVEQYATNNNNNAISSSSSNTLDGGDIPASEDSTRKRRHRRTVSDPLRFLTGRTLSNSTMMMAATTTPSASTVESSASSTPVQAKTITPNPSTSTGNSGSSSGGVRVRVRVEMPFNIFFSDEVGEVPVAKIRAELTRSFVSVVDRGVAVGQGEIEVFVRDVTKR